MWQKDRTARETHDGIASWPSPHPEKTWSASVMTDSSSILEPNRVQAWSDVDEMKQEMSGKWHHDSLNPWWDWNIYSPCVFNHLWSDPSCLYLEWNNIFSNTSFSSSCFNCMLIHQTSVRSETYVGRRSGSTFTMLNVKRTRSNESNLWPKSQRTLQGNQRIKTAAGYVSATNAAHPALHPFFSCTTLKLRSPNESKKVSRQWNGQKMLQEASPPAKPQASTLAVLIRLL